MELRRGDLVTVTTSGDYGKPRPAVVIQSNTFGALPSVTVLRLTSDIRDWPLFRITVRADSGNGLKKTSQIMIDKAAAVPKAKIAHRPPEPRHHAIGERGACSFSRVVIMTLDEA